MNPGTMFITKCNAMLYREPSHDYSDIEIPSHTLGIFIESAGMLYSLVIVGGYAGEILTTKTEKI